MDAQSTEQRRDIIRRVFPDLRYGGDPDLERYFEYRRAGRLGEALDIYNGPLRSRYPDDRSRVLLLRLYREKDPRWKDLQDRLILELAGRISLLLERNIDVLVAPLANVHLSNAFKALSTVEALLRVIPAKDDEALGFLDKYVGFARLFDHRTAEVDKARELVAEYLAMAKAESPADYDFVARSRAMEERRRDAEARVRALRGEPGGRQEPQRVDFIARSEALERRRRKEEASRARYFDLSRIHFGPADIARIEIPPELMRREDRVLAYCWKYWELVPDPGFERLVFLYAKKYGTRHYAIFRAIKSGRAQRLTDDEILTEVSTILSTSYSYSVSADLYMQANWRRLKARAAAGRAAAAGAGLARTPGVSEAEMRMAFLRQAERPAAALEPPQKAASAPPRPALPSYTPPSRAPRAAMRAETHIANAPARQPSRDVEHGRHGVADAAPLLPRPRRTGPAERPASPTVATEPLAASRGKAIEAGAVRSAGAGLRPLRRPETKVRKPGLSAPRKPAAPVETISAPSGSVSDRIRRISGKAYDVYRQIFLEGVRDDIRRHLLANRTRSFRLFDDSTNAAEDLVYHFMAAHYADPFMDWEGSEERSRAEALGFALPSLDPIIEAWFRRL